MQINLHISDFICIFAAKFNIMHILSIWQGKIGYCRVEKDKK